MHTLGQCGFRDVECLRSTNRLTACRRASRAAAAANRRKGGRPRKVDDADAAKARQLWQKGTTASDIAKMLEVSRATVYRYLSDGVPLST